MGGRPEAPIAISPQIRGADLGVWLEGSLSSQSGEPFRLMVESVIDYAVFMLDSQGRIATWNKGAERIKGYSAEQIVGKHFSIFYSPADIESGLPERMLAIATQLGRHEGEGWRLRKSGESFWANVVITALLDDTGKLVGFGKFPQDLTERRKAEHEIRTAQEHLRLMVEATADYAMIMLDPQGIVVTWNKGAERIKGYTANAILGQHFSVFYPREAIESGRPDRELVTAAEQGRYEDEGWRVRKGGSRFWANVVVTALRDETGKLVGFGKVTRDLTERRRTEQGLEAAYDQLNSVLECTSDSVFKINRDWILVYGNRKATESLPDFTLGRSYWDCFPAARGTFIEEILRTAMKMRSSASYENYYAPYQQWYRGNIYPTDDGLSIFFTNITEEKALKEKAEREQFLKEKRIEALSHMAGGWRMRSAIPWQSSMRGPAIFLRPLRVQMPCPQRMSERRLRAL